MQDKFWIHLPLNVFSTFYPGLNRVRVLPLQPFVSRSRR